METEKRLIDADSLIRQIKLQANRTSLGEMSDPYMTWQDVVRLILEAPTVDAVEVVRCKDCKWFNNAGCAISIVDDSDKPKEMDFCSYGERTDINEN